MLPVEILRHGAAKKNGKKSLKNWIKLRPAGVVFPAAH